MADLAEHSIYSFHSYRGDFSKPLAPKFADLVKPGRLPEYLATDFERHRAKTTPVWVPEANRAACAGRYGGDDILMPFQPELGGDLYAPLLRLVAGDQPDRCRTYALTRRATDFLKNGKLYEEDAPPESKVSRQLALVLPKKAEQRYLHSQPEGSQLSDQFRAVRSENGELKACFVIPIHISNFTVYHFATDRIICQMRIEASLPSGQKINTGLLTEMVDCIGRFAELGWLEEGGTAIGNTSLPLHSKLLHSEEFSLGGLVSRLLFGEHGFYDKSHRTFTHTYLQFDADEAALRENGYGEIARRLARQYTEDYALSNNADGFHEISDFENLLHTITKEGSSTLISPRTAGYKVDFLRDYRKNSLERVYLPLVVLNLHQHTRGLELAARSVLSTTDHRAISHNANKIDTQVSAAEIYIEQWKILQDDLAHLNSRYRFHQVSQITMHDKFNAALRHAFGLNELERQLSADLHDMANRVQNTILELGERRARAFQRKYSAIPIVVAGLLALSTAAQTVSAYNSIPSGSSNYFIGIEIAIPVLAFVVTAIWAYAYSKTTSRLGKT